MEISKIISKIRKLEITTRKLVQNVFEGEYRSIFRGTGITFSEVRKYSIGDDYRKIDRNVTARTGESHIKLFQEERERIVYLIIDVSHSVFYAESDISVRDIIQEISAIIAFSASMSNDKVGLILFSDKIEKYIPPQKGKKHIMRILRDVFTQEARSQFTSYPQAFHFLNRIGKKQSIAFILSDFFNFKESKELLVSGKKFDVIGLGISYPPIVPNLGFITLQDLETKRNIMVDTSDISSVGSLLLLWEKMNAEKKKIFEKSNSNFVSLNLKEDYINEFSYFLRSRIRR